MSSREFEVLIVRNFFESDQKSSVCSLSKGIGDNFFYDSIFRLWCKINSFSRLVKELVTIVNNDFRCTFSVNQDFVLIFRASDDCACSLSTRVERNLLKNVIFFLSNDIISVNSNIHEEVNQADFSAVTFRNIFAIVSFNSSRAVEKHSLL